MFTRLTQESYSAFIQHTGVGMALASVKTKKWLTANPALLRLLGYSLEEFTSLTYSDVTPNEFQAADRYYAQRLISGRARSVDFEKKLIRKDGSEIWVLLSCALVELQDLEQGYVACFHDLTAQKRAEQQLLNRNLELEKFVRLISHDFRQPLRTVLARIIFAKENLKLPENNEPRESLDLAADTLSRLGQLVDKIVRYTNKAAKPEGDRVVNVYDIVQQVLTDVSFLVQNSAAKITVHQDRSFWPEVKLRHDLLVCVLQNLITNAIKAVAAGVLPVVEVSCCRRGDKYRVSVKDNGIGISEKDKEKILQPFCRLEDSVSCSGFGIGLYLVNSTLQVMHEQLIIDSQQGSGSTFTFTIDVKHATNLTS